MSIFKALFSRRQQETGHREQLSSIYQRLQAELPQLDERDHTFIACLAGLLARVAFVDLDISDSEFQSMAHAIGKTTSYSDEVAQKIASVAREEVGKLVDHEHHLYVRPLNDILERTQKEDVLRLLFQVAAADGRVENLESEEIRRISKELRLSHQQFVQAKLTVREQIQALKG